MGQSGVVAEGNSMIVALDNSHVEAAGDVRLHLMDHASALVKDRVVVLSEGDNRIEANGDNEIAVVRYGKYAPAEASINAASSVRQVGLNSESERNDYLNRNYYNVNPNRKFIGL